MVYKDLKPSKLCTLLFFLKGAINIYSHDFRQYGINGSIYFFLFVRHYFYLKLYRRLESLSCA